MQELSVREPLSGIEKSKADKIEATFAPMVKMLKGFEEAYDNVMALDETDPETAKKAKRLRLDVARVRIETGKLKDKQKEYIKLEDKAIMGVHNILVFAVKEKEDKLKEIETYSERIEAEKKKEIQTERASELEKYDVSSEFVDLANMPDDVWANYLSGVKANYGSVKEAEKKAEEDRIEAERKQTNYDQRLKALLSFGNFFDKSKLTIDSTDDDFEQIIMDAKTGRTAHLEEQERIKAENEALKKQQEADRLKAEKETKAREKKEEEARILREKEQAKKDEAFRVEREKRETLEREAKEKEEARLKAEREAEADRLKAEKAPDKEKLFSVAKKLRNTKVTVKSKQAINALEDAAVLLDSRAESM